MKSYAIIQDHVISWILIRYHRFNLTESTDNVKKSTTTKKIHFEFFFKAFINFEFIKKNFKKK